MFSMWGVVEAMDLRNGALVVLSNRDLKVGHKTKLRVALPPGSGKVVTVEVEITSRRPHPKSGFIYSTQLLTDLGNLEFKGSDPLLREDVRSSASLRVMAKELPGFRAMTVDFSNSGAQLEVDDEVAVGTRLNLNFDIDWHHVTRLSVPAKTMWCRPLQHSDKCRIGVQFVDLSAELQAQLDELAAHLEKRSHTDLHDLLEEAKLLGPSIAPAASAAAARAEVAASQPAPAPAAPDLSEEPVAVERRVTPRFLLLPLQAQLESYQRQRGGEVVVRLLAESGESQSLIFPEARYFADHGFEEHPDVRGLRSFRQSELLTQLQRPDDLGTSKHYQLLDSEGTVVLEIVSSQCRPG